MLPPEPASITVLRAALTRYDKDASIGAMVRVIEAARELLDAHDTHRAALAAQLSNLSGI